MPSTDRRSAGLPAGESSAAVLPAEILPVRGARGTGRAVSAACGRNTGEAGKISSETNGLSEAKPPLRPPVPAPPHTRRVTGRGVAARGAAGNLAIAAELATGRPARADVDAPAFDRDQGRLPARSAARAARPSGGGAMDARAGYAQVHRVSRRRGGGGQIRIGGRWHLVTPAQEVLLAQSYSAMRRAVRDVRKVDPEWRPPAQAYSTVEGLISANRAVENEARRHIFERRDTGAGLGPYAREWMPAPSTNRRLTRAEQREVDRLGREHGCHRCGSTEPGTSGGSFIGDHQMPKSIGTPTRIYPHCRWCSASQGGLLRQYFRGKK